MHEKCGVVAVVDLDEGENAESDVVPIVVEMTKLLEHRGPLGAGIAWCSSDGGIRSFKGHGRATDVLHADHLRAVEARARAAIGHTRYATNGVLDPGALQPWMSPELAFAFNGNIAEYADQRSRLIEAGCPPEMDGDTEIIGRTLIHGFRGGNRRSIHRALKGVGGLDGCYNLVVLQPDGSISAVRDPHGFRPLAWAQKGSLIAVASEDSAIKGVWYGIKTHSVKPGEFLHAMPGFKNPVPERLWKEEKSICFFEFIYFSDHRSRIDGRSVANVRYECGRILAEMDADGPSGYVVPVPESAKIAADGYVNTRGLRRVDVICKNPGIGRTFITPTGEREALASRKYDIDEDLLRGRDIILIDDSLVRGTTLRVLVSQLRNKGVGKIHLRLASPPILSPCFYGIDFATTRQLLVRKYFNGPLREGDVLPDDVLAAAAADVGVDSIKFLPVSAIPRALGMEADDICMACVTGRYPTPKGQELALQAELGLIDRHGKAC
jgi:amidophosphoribosyltransferase